MYKILYIPTGIILNITSQPNKAESDKFIKFLCKDYNSSGYIYSDLKSLLPTQIYEPEFESIFVNEPSRRFQIMYISSNCYFPYYFNDKAAATKCLWDALGKQYQPTDLATELRLWILPLVTSRTFNNTKAHYRHHITSFTVVEV